MDRRTFALTLIGAGFAADAFADDTLSKVLAAATKSKGLTSGEADTGLREALSAGARAAVTQVSRPDGYWGDNLIRIPLPKTLAKVQSTLKPLGMSGALDDVHSAMNHAAESAAPVAKDLFIDAIKAMTLKNAIGIVNGGPTSGTEYLRTATSPRLTTLFTPPISSALEKTGAVTALDRAIVRNNLKSYVREDPKTYLSKHAVGFALSGLFHYVGEEERAIRTDPGKRTSEILRRVFG